MSGSCKNMSPQGAGKRDVKEVIRSILVFATAESLLKNPRAVIKIDCAEFQHSHEIAKLIGSPPGLRESIEVEQP